MIRDLMRSIAAASVVAALLACGSDSTSSRDPLESVTVEPRDATLKIFALWPHMHQLANSRAGLEIKTTAVWSSSNASKVSVDASTGDLTAADTGSADISATVTVDGVSKSGVSHVTVAMPTDSAGVAAAPTIVFSPQLQSVSLDGKSARVTWSFGSVPHTVVWDSQPDGAAITDIDSNSNATVSRDFAVAGIYEYHCSIHSNMTGTIYVQ